MLQIVIQNERSMRLDLTSNENIYQVTKVSGLNPPNATISSTDNVYDGASYNHSRVETRNIVIDGVINGNVEENRLKMYQVLQTKKYVKLYLKSYSKYVWIDGYIEAIEVDNYNQKTPFQISILCHSPYMKSVEMFINSMNIVKGNFYFPFYTVEPIPFSVYSKITILNLINEGNVESGMTIELTAHGEVENPIVYNRQRGHYIGIGNTDRPFKMIAGDKIIITTGINEKKIKLVRNAVETNIFNYLTKGSRFLTLEAGTNVFTYSAWSGNEVLDITFKHYAHYTGI